MLDGRRVGGRRLVVGAAVEAAAGDRLAEAVAELLRRERIDDRVDARVEVGEAVPEQADRAVHGARRYVAEVGDQQVDVDRQPEEGEDDDDEDDEAARLALLRLRFRLLAHRARPVLVDVVQDGDAQRRDHQQRQHVGEREEVGVEALAERLAVVIALGEPVDVAHVEGDEDRHVDDQHHHPDGARRQHRITARAHAHRARVVHDRHVAHDGDEHERVDGHVGGDVEQVVHQLADDDAERPAVGGDQLVSGERRTDEHERQVGQRQVQQQQVRHGAHAPLDDNHVDDETVADGTDERHQAEEDRDGDDVDDVRREDGRGGVLGGLRRRVYEDCRRHRAERALGVGGHVRGERQNANRLILSTKRWYYYARVYIAAAHGLGGRCMSVEAVVCRVTKMASVNTNSKAE